MTRGKGIGGHQSATAKTETWLTPKWVLDALGTFNLDPCAAPEPRPWDTAVHHYTAPAQNGLVLPWFGRVWLNPPYGKAVGAWLKRLARHACGTALVFARTETDAFFETVWHCADAALFLRGRLHFHHADGRRATANGGAPSVLVAYGPEDAERLMASKLDGHLVALKRPVLLALAIEPPSTASAVTWRALVAEALRKAGGACSLSDLYAALAGHEKVQANPHWREKVRQTVQRMRLPKTPAGQYALAV